MKAISHFLRITVLGGVLFLTPIVVLAFILGKAFDLARRGLKPMATIIPDRFVSGVTMEAILAIVLIAICAFSPACSPEPGRRSESWPSWSLPFCPRFLLMSI
jgi:hypothetical protein